MEGFRDNGQKVSPNRNVPERSEGAVYSGDGDVPTNFKDNHTVLIWTCSATTDKLPDATYV